MTVRIKIINYHFMHQVLEDEKRAYLNNENKIKVIYILTKVPYRGAYMIKRRKKSFQAN